MKYWKFVFIFILTAPSLVALAAITVSPSQDSVGLNSDSREETLRSIAAARAALDAELNLPVPPRTSTFKAIPRRDDIFEERSDESNCGHKDFREKLGDVRNQDSLGSCFAYVDADLLTAKYGRKISGLDLQLSYYQSGVPGNGPNRYQELSANDSVTSLENGSLLYAMDVVAQRGVCLEEDVHSTDYIQSESINPNSMLGLTVAQMSEDKKGDIGWLSSLLQTIEGFQDANRNHASVYSEAVCTSIEASKILFPNLNTASILYAMKTSERKADYIRWLQALSCGTNKIKFPDLNYIGFGLENNNSAGPRGYRFLPKLDELIDQENPVAIVYHRDFVLPNGGDNELHTSILVGREFRDGQCQYLVRNSFGPTEGQYTRDNERGHFWITEKEIHENVVEIGYLR